MNALGRYSTVGFLVVLCATAVLWPFLDAAGHRSLLVAGAVALPVQIGAFWLLNQSQDDPSRFMLWWGAGVLGRIAIVIGAGVALTQFGGLSPVVLLLSLAGFFFALLLLEPAFFVRSTDTTPFAR